jgi:hypothetical protein
VPPFVLLVLKIVFVALLYFFIYRSLRSVVLDLRAAPAGARRGDTGAGRAHKAPPSRTRPPRSVAVLDERGTKLGTHELDGNLQIGRAEACHIKLSDTYVSQFHARIFRRDDSWYVEDVGSTNGTYVNQRRVSAPAMLHAGDRVKVGKTTLELRR